MEAHDSSSTNRVTKLSCHIFEDPALSSMVGLWHVLTIITIKFRLFRVAAVGIEDSLLNLNVDSIHPATLLCQLRTEDKDKA